MSENTAPATETVETDTDPGAAVMVHLEEIQELAQTGGYGPEGTDDVMFLLSLIAHLHDEGSTFQEIAARQSSAIRLLVQAATDGNSEALVKLLDAALRGTGLIGPDDSVAPEILAGELTAPNATLIVPNRAQRRAAERLARKSGK